MNPFNEPLNGQDLESLKDFAKKVRLNSLEMAFQKKASHLGGAFSIADVLAVLYGKVLSKKVSDPQWIDRDRLFYSKGHACTALYSALQVSGYYSDSVKEFCTNGSYFTSHVNHKVPGIELSTGSLGHALSVATGVALAGKKQKKSYQVYCIVSDGELDEGSNWESILLAPHLKLDNLTLIVDYNKIQSFGTTKQVLDLDPLDSKFKAFRWNTSVIDGHNLSEIYQAFKSKESNGLPSVVIANTIKGKGVSFMENKLAWHYKSPSAEEYATAQKEILA